MRVTVQKAAEGLATYFDRELVPKTPGLRKWGLGLLGARAGKMVQYLADKHSDMLMAIGIMNDDKTIEADELMAELKRIASSTGPVTESIPVFGSWTFDAGDIDKLYTYIIS